MIIKKALLHALISAVLASIACIIYITIYSKALEVNFSSVLNAGGATGACVFGCLLMGLSYFGLIKWKGSKWIGALNIVIAVLSFASIVGVLGFQLPVTVESPELFPGLAIPLHFFPALSFLSIAPFFKYS